jgi:hypothetical protein
LYDEDLDALDEGIRRLKVEYGIFFNGNRKKPPDDLRMRVERLIKRLSETPALSYSQRFRLNTLVTRFYVLRDMWRRKIAERESAATARTERLLQRTQVCICDGDRETEKIQELYDAVLRISNGCVKKTPTIGYARFAEYITRQTQTIRAKYRCSGVMFTVALEEDTIRFTAKAELKS